MRHLEVYEFGLCMKKPSRLSRQLYEALMERDICLVAHERRLRWCVASNTGYKAKNRQTRMLHHSDIPRIANINERNHSKPLDRQMVMPMARLDASSCPFEPFLSGINIDSHPDELRETKSSSSNVPRSVSDFLCPRRSFASLI